MKSIFASQKAGENSLHRTFKPLTGKFAGAVMAAGLALSPMAASAQDNSQDGQTSVHSVSTTQPQLRETAHCAPLHVKDSGHQVSASASAWKYSDDSPGKIGIAIYPGQDLNGTPAEDWGTFYVNTFRKAGVEAECFIQGEVNDAGTGIDFKVNGISRMGSENRDKAFNLDEALDKDRLRSLVAEAKTGRMLLVSKEASLGFSPDGLNP